VYPQKEIPTTKDPNRPTWHILQEKKDSYISRNIVKLFFSDSFLGLLEFEFVHSFFFCDGLRVQTYTLDLVVRACECKRKCCPTKINRPTRPCYNSSLHNDQRIFEPDHTNSANLLPFEVTRFAVELDPISLFPPKVHGQYPMNLIFQLLEVNQYGLLSLFHSSILFSSFVNPVESQL